MKYLLMFAAVLLLLSNPAQAARERLLLDFGWRFQLTDPTDARGQFDYPEIKNLQKATATDETDEQKLAANRGDPVATNLGAQVSTVQPDFDDSAWRKLDLPHDWAVELPFSQSSGHGPGDVVHGSKDLDPAKGTTIGWYRRQFDLPASDKGRALWIEFDGVYRNSLVWLNGHCLGRHVSGYTSFFYDISKAANFGGKNTLVVRVDASHTEGWFYEGAGIYRHVWLMKTDAVHVAHWGSYVVSDVHGADADVTVQTTVANDSQKAASVRLFWEIDDADGKTIVMTTGKPITIEPGKTQEVSRRIPLSQVKLWSLESPYLYKVVTTVWKNDGSVADVYETPFGIRTIKFDPDHGFFLNGKHVTIQGTCNHQDHAGVGSALPDQLQTYRLQRLRDFGCNAIRCSHNPPAPELLDACDRMGMLVMDEQRKMGDTPEKLDELRSVMLRDRNHPSVILWSLCNEEPLQTSAAGFAMMRNMKSLAVSLDNTRPITAGTWGAKGFIGLLDVEGCNYIQLGSVDQFHAANPTIPLVGSEESSMCSTRGIYADDRAKGYLWAYDQHHPGWGKTAQEWLTYYAQRPFLAGAFVWTGFDYRGEPNPYGWPDISSEFGILDTCGFPKDIYYYYQTFWTDQPVLHLMPHWNAADKNTPRKTLAGKPLKPGQVEVVCYTSHDEVELFINGKTQGKQPAIDHQAHWVVTYDPGTLEARGYTNGQLIETVLMQTTGDPAKIILTADRSEIAADGEDVSMVTVSAADAQGRPVPTAMNLIHFTITGGKIIGIGNGDPTCHESDKGSQRSLFNGLAQVIVQSTKNPGPIVLKATGDGLDPAKLTITADPCTPRPAVP